MEEVQTIDLVCRLAGYVTEQPIPVEFRLAAIGVILLVIVILAEKASEHFG